MFDADLLQKKLNKRYANREKAMRKVKKNFSWHKPKKTNREINDIIEIKKLKRVKL